MKKTKLIATLLVAGMLCTGCGIIGGKAVIKVDDQVITKGQIEKAIDKQIASSPLAKAGNIKANKDSMLYLMTEKSVLNQLIIQAIFDKEIKNRGIKVTEKDVNEAINGIIDKVGSKEQLNKILKDNGVSVRDFKKDIENQVKLKKLAQASSDTKVSDSEVKSFYDSNRQMFTHKEQVRASHILIPTNPTQVEQEIVSTSKKQIEPSKLKKQVDEKIMENRKLAQKLADELKANDSKFENYAKKYSKDYTTAQRGGDLGYFEADRMVPEFAQAAFNAKPNSVIGPVQTVYGLHIIKVVDRVAAGTESFDKVKSDLKERLQTQKELKTLDNIINAAKKKANIVYLDKKYDPNEIEKKLQEQIRGLQEAATGAKK